MSVLDANEANDLRTLMRELMTCPHCGTSRLSLSAIARAAHVSKSALFYFLNGSTAGSRVATRLRSWLAIERPFGYNSGDGSSVKSNSIAPDTRSPATTRSAGVTASIGVVDR